MGLLGGAGSTICQLCLSALWRWGLRCCHVSHEHDARGSRAFSNQYEIHGKFHEHERDVKGVDTTAWAALVDMLLAYEDVDALSDAIDAFDLRRCWRSGRASWRSSRLRRWQEAHMRRLAGRGWVLHRPLGWTPTFYHQDPPA